MVGLLALAGWYFRGETMAFRETPTAGVHGSGKGAILCVHSVFQGRESAAPLARELARATGATTYSVYLQGPGPFSEYERQLESLCSSLAPVALVGHSMGADLCCSVARRRPDLVVGTVAVGFPVPREEAPPQLLRAVGMWDELHSVNEIDANLVLLRSDHNLENYDPDLYDGVAAWLAPRLGTTVTPALRPTPYVARGMLAWAGLLAVAWLPLAPRRRLAVGVVGALLGFPSLWLGALVGPGSAWLGLLGGACAMGILSNAAGNLWVYPAGLLDFPMFMLLALPVYLLKLEHMLWLPVVLALSGLEAWRPGTLWKAVLLVPRAFARLDLRLRWDVQPAHLALLVLLVGGAVVAWGQTLSAGYGLTQGDVLRLLGKGLALVLLPLTVLAVGARHPYFRALLVLVLLACPAPAERSWKTGWSTEEILDSLAHSKVRSIHRLQDALGPAWDGSNDFHVLELESGLKAVFRSEDEPWGSMAELAGYRMDGFLRTELVPPTVERTLTDAEVPGWPWSSKTRPGSVQLWIETGPPSDASLADAEVLSFVMGRYDNHDGNLLYDRAGRPVVVDFESAMDIQQVRYGEVPFVRRGVKHKGDRANVAGAFPFDHPQVLKDPTLAQIRARFGPWWTIWPQGMAGLHRMLAHIPGRLIPYAIWGDRLWVQVKVKSRHPAYTAAVRPATWERLQALDAAALTGVLVPPMGAEHERGILERAGQVLAASRGK